MARAKQINGSTAVKPYKFYDRRGTSNGYAGSPNKLYESVQNTGQRKDVRRLDKDTHCNVSNMGRRDAMSIGRWLFANSPLVRGMLLEQANLAVGSFIPQFYGDDKEWGDAAENALLEWNRICDWRGWPYDYTTWTQSLIVAEQRDGDKFTVQVTGEDGYPFIQSVPGHRVTNRSGLVDAGDGLFNMDGAIVDAYGRVVAWRVYRDEYSLDNFEDVGADVMFPTYVPVWDDQVRGFSALATSSNIWQDFQETRNNELVAQNAFSRVTILETTPDGTADQLQKLIKTAAQRDSSNNLIQDPGEVISAGTIRYLRAGSGSNVEAFQHDRPGSNTQQFLDLCIRDAFAGNEASMFFYLDPSRVGGGPMRMIVDRVMRVIQKRQRMVEKSCRRVHGWVISKFIKLGLLPDNPQWWMWKYQAPAEITADKKYDSDVDVQELSADITTEERAAGKRGEYWEDVQDQRLREKFRKIRRAKELAAEYGLDEAEAREAAKASSATVPNRTPREPIESKEKGGKEEE